MTVVQPREPCGRVVAIREKSRLEAVTSRDSPHLRGVTLADLPSDDQNTRMKSFQVPAFQPHRLFRGGHAQTLSAHFLKGHSRKSQSMALPPARQHRVDLPDGDAFVIHENPPHNLVTDLSDTHEPGAVLLFPGLTGCHQSGYMQRSAAKLSANGFRVFRVDPRGWGASQEMARNSFHAGRTEDFAAAVRYVAEYTPETTLHMVGFSLSGNLVLKYLANRSTAEPPVARAAALCPAIDLAMCAKRLDGWMSQRIYGRHYLKYLCKHLQKLGRWPETESLSQWGKRSLREFDESFTAPTAGFESAMEYYMQSSSKQDLHRIDLPTLIIAAADDPVVPVSCFEELELGPQTHVHIAPSGGHLGFIGRRGIDDDRRWLEWRILDWLTHPLEPILPKVAVERRSIAGAPA